MIPVGRLLVYLSFFRTEHKVFEMIDDFGDEVPFEELDGCCQKEVLQQRRNKELKAELRVGDRSNERFDLQQTVFTIRNHCACCEDSKDYPLLAKVRNEQSLFCGECITESVLENESEDSDDDFLLDDFVSPQEQERKAEFLENQKKIACAKQYGLACHLEDSLDHVVADIAAGIEVVLHIFRPDEVLCAKLDLYLESISLKYFGTKFRRIKYSHGLGSDARFSSFGVKDGDFARSSSGSLLCFRGRSLSAASRIDEFAEGSSLHTEDVWKFLDGCRVLSTEVPLERLLSSERASTATAATDGHAEAETEAFCDDPDCTKRYAHEHVGRRGAGPVSFLLDSRQQGMDALTAGALQHL